MLVYQRVSLNHLDFDHSTVSSYEQMEYHHQVAPDRSSEASEASVKLRWFFSVVFFIWISFFWKKTTNKFPSNYSQKEWEFKKKWYFDWSVFFGSASQGYFQRIYFHRFFRNGSASPWHHDTMGKGRAPNRHFIFQPLIFQRGNPRNTWPFSGCKIHLFQ